MNTTSIPVAQLVWAYLLALIPLGLMLWYGIDLLGQTLMALVRMTVQLLLVGVYLKVVFDLNHPSLTLAWLVVMVAVADLSVMRGCHLRVRRMGIILFPALLAGSLLPMLFFTTAVFRASNPFEAQLAIPIGGMILGNCLRANIVGVSRFCNALREREKVYLLSLAQGATLREAVLPFLRESIRGAMAPTVANIATVGVVWLPGMMTGVILGGAEPMEAIKYQLVIMLAMLSGTAITLWIALRLTIRWRFTPYGLLDKSIFQPSASD